MSPKPHSLVATVNGKEQRIDSQEDIVGHVSRMTVVVDRFDHKLKCTLSGFVYDESVIEDLRETVSLDAVSHPNALGNLVYPKLGESGGTQGGEYNRPTLLFRWAGQQTMTVQADFGPQANSISREPSGEPKPPIASLLTSTSNAAAGLPRTLRQRYLRLLSAYLAPQLLMRWRSTL